MKCQELSNFRSANKQYRYCVKEFPERRLKNQFNLSRMVFIEHLLCDIK